jgi:hypothetical protein
MTVHVNIHLARSEWEVLQHGLDAFQIYATNIFRTSTLSSLIVSMLSILNLLIL